VGDGSHTSRGCFALSEPQSVPSDPPDLDVLVFGSGGLSSEGEIGYENLPPQARYVWFDFFTTSDDEHRVIRVTVDLATGTVQTQK
jgi:hypothetical protein